MPVRDGVNSTSSLDFRQPNLRRIFLLSSRYCLHSPEDQKVLVPVQPLLPNLPIRKESTIKFPERAVMSAVPQVTEFVNDGVFEHRPRRKDEMPVQAHDTIHPLSKGEFPLG